MADSKQNYIEKLRLLNLSLRAQLEQAEARIPVLNDLIKQFAAIELVTETALLGLVIYEGHYSVLTGPDDSGPVLQAALLIPGGLGVICWDSEEFATFRKQPPQIRPEVFLKFMAFDFCPSAIKALLLPQVEPLMELLMNRIRFLHRGTDSE